MPSFDEAQPSVAYSIGKLVKVSNETPSVEELTAEDTVAQVVYMGEIMSGPLWQFGVSPTQLSDTAYSFILDGMHLITVCTESFELQPGVVLEPGVHFIWADGMVGVMSATRQAKEDIYYLEPKYIKDMYYEKTVEVLPETTLVDGNDGQFMLEPQLPFVVGETYDVTYNRVKYACECYSSTVEGITMVGIGNSAMFGAEDTGEPFCIGNIPLMPGTTMVVDLSGADTCTLSIYSDIIHKIDSKFIDAEWMATKTEVPAVIIPETTVTLTTDDDMDQGCYTANVESLDAKPFALGQTYVVTLDGTSVDCQVRSIDFFDVKLFYLGNLSFTTISDAEDTGEPFLVIASDGNVGLSMQYQGEVAFKLESKDRVNTIYHRLPVEYLPDSVATKEYVEQVILGGAW